MNTPTHEAVARRAHQIWQNSGSPNGRDTEIWLEAERQLADESPGARGNSGAATLEPARPTNKSAGDTTTEARLKAETAAESVVEYQISPGISEEEAIKAALQKQEARAPIAPHKEAPKAKPPESGKPLWSHPHSS